MRQIVLMYHDLYLQDKSESGFQNSTALKYKVSAEAFEAQVQALVRYIKLGHIRSDSIDFTFDDGGISSITIAAPILEKYGFKGKFYISTAYIGTNGFLNKEQVKELNQRGHYVGNHSHTHPDRMNILSADKIKEEWLISQTILMEILGFSPKLASIPNGYVSKQCIDELLKIGIDLVDTSSTTTHIKQYKTAILRGRYAITEDTTIDDLMKLVSSPFYRCLIKVRYEILEIAKIVLGDSYLTIRKKILEK